MGEKEIQSFVKPVKTVDVTHVINAIKGWIDAHML